MSDKTKEEQKKFFGKALNTLIYNANIMSMDLAKYLGVSESSVSGWINGIYLPRYDTMRKIADYFGVGISDLLGDYDCETEDEYSKACAELGMSDVDFCSMVIDYYRMSNEQRDTVKKLKDCIELVLSDNTFCSMITDYCSMTKPQRDTIKDFYLKFFEIKKTRR